MNVPALPAHESRPTPDTLYDRDYYLRDCEGFQEFVRTRGRKLPRRLRKCLDLLCVQPEERVIDVGCGRGELALHLAAAGAHVVALDPAQAALELLGEAAISWGARPIRVRARGEALPVRDGWADALVLADVVEHLPPAGLHRLLCECRRALRRGGRMIVHTQPNRTLVRVTAPLLSRISRLWGVTLPRDLSSESSAGTGPEYHPGEQSHGGLRKAIEASGLSIEESWLEGSYAVHRKIGKTRLKQAVLRSFRRSPLLKSLLATRIFAMARKPIRGA